MHEEHQLNILHKMSEIVSQMTFTNEKGKACENALSGWNIGVDQKCHSSL